MKYVSKPMIKSEFGVYRNTTSRKWNTQVCVTGGSTMNNSSGTLHRAFDSETRSETPGKSTLTQS